MINSWRPSPALLLAFIALLVALGGTAVANADRLPLIGSHHVADNSLRSKDIRDGTLKRRDFRSGALRGPSGAADPVSVTRISASGTGSATATCPTGAQVLSGGGGSTAGGTLQTSLPSGDNTEWEVISSDATAVVVAYAYCSADVTVTP
jgi:hypothetical protein